MDKTKEKLGMYLQAWTDPLLLTGSEEDHSALVLKSGHFTNKELH